MGIAILSLSAIVTRLKGLSIFKQIEGAAELEKVIAGGVRIAPAGFVIPLNENAAANSTGSMLTTQRVESRFAVVYGVKNISDRTGSAAIDSGLRPLRLATLQALVGWAPVAEFNICAFDGGSLIRIDNGVVLWRDRFVTSHINEN